MKQLRAEILQQELRGQLRKRRRHHPHRTRQEVECALIEFLRVFTWISYWYEGGGEGWGGRSEGMLWIWHLQYSSHFLSLVTSRSPQCWFTYNELATKREYVHTVRWEVKLVERSKRDLGLHLHVEFQFECTSILLPEGQLTQTWGWGLICASLMIFSVLFRAHIQSSICSQQKHQTEFAFLGFHIWIQISN